MASTAATGKRTVVLGGKGSSLTSSAVFQAANDVARVSIESSALSRHSTSKTTNTDSTKERQSSFSIAEYLNPEEAKASVILLIKELLISSPSSSSILHLLEAIESKTLSTNYTLNNSGKGSSVIDFDSAAVHGIAAIVDHKCSGLTSIIDATAAISCEALKADVTAFDLMDSGDGSSFKDAVAVASDLKVLLNGSKLAGSKKDGFDLSTAQIPSAHGCLRESLRLVHSKCRVGLNSGFGIGSARDVSGALSCLAMRLVDIGENCARRVDLIVNSMVDKDLRSRLMEKIPLECHNGNALGDKLESCQSAWRNKDYVLSAHCVYELLDVVWRIVSWEGVVAFVSLEGSEVFGGGIDESNGNVPEVSTGGVEKKDKKGDKKKKVVLGKGTSAWMQFIKEKLLAGAMKVDLNRFVQESLLLLDPRGSSFEELVSKVKEIVESNESRRLPKLPKGTRDFAKEQMAVREKAFAIIVNVFKKHGAMALDTPVFEMRETLMGKYGEDSKLIYDLADQGGELCSLRYDLTVPFARYVAMNGLTSFKRYQIAKVYRRDNPSKGRYREFYQCDLDIAGQFEKMGPDFEVVKILTELLDRLDIGDYEVKLNHRKLLDGMLAICGVPPEKFRTICSSIDKLDKQSFEQVKKEMVEEKGLSEESADKIGTFVKHRGSPMELLSKLKQEGSEFLTNSESELALNELEILFESLEKSKCVDKVVFDLSLARGLDYYTGVIFEAIFKGTTQVGSIAAGGRYDNLIGMFGTKQVPAVGISLGIERVFAIMEQLQKDKNQEIRATETQVLVSILGEKLSVGAEIVSELWDADVEAEFMVNKRVSKHIDRARGSKIPYMAIVGDQELSKGTVKLKDLNAVTEDEIPRTELVERLKRRLNRV